MTDIDREIDTPEEWLKNKSKSDLKYDFDGLNEFYVIEKLKIYMQKYANYYFEKKLETVMKNLFPDYSKKEKK